MKKLRQLICEFLESKHESPTIVIDLFDEVARAIEDKQIRKGENAAFDYEVSNLIEVFDFKKFPEDYEFLTELSDILEDL